MTEILDDYVTPGTPIGTVREYSAGKGTYVMNDRIFASVVGKIESKQSQIDETNKETQQNSDSKPFIEIVQESEKTVVPKSGSVVIGKVKKITARFAVVKILCVESKALKQEYKGIIRKEDIRQFEVDRIEISKCFRPGDVVRAEVVSLGDVRSYYLSTSKDELGVIFAQSVAGANMIPISWQEMQCPKTKMKEFRKVAKVT